MAEEGNEQADAAKQLRIREKLVRCIWFDQFLDIGNLKAEDGRKVSVFSPGYWNTGAGPDFRNAEIAFESGVRLRGDVEVHVKSSDWKQHGHANDPAYVRVALHVVLHNDLRKETVVHDAREIPQLVLEKHLATDLGEIIKSLDTDGYPRVGVGREGACCRSIRAFGRSEQWVSRFLSIAGDERILNKAERFKIRMEETTPDEVLYEALMETMGYSANRRGFRRLAGLVSLSHLRRFVPLDADFSERLLAVQALLFGGGGFLDHVQFDLDDQKSREYVGALREIWESGPSDLICPPLDPSSWQFKRTRPTNHPIRRVAGISAFLAAHLHSGLCHAMMTAVEQVSLSAAERVRCRQTVDGFRLLFEDNSQDYWARRTTFGSERLSRQTRLIGPTRAIEMIVNVVIPVLLALSRQERRMRLEYRLHNVYRSLRPLTDNSVTGYMKTRIFGDVQKGARVVRNLCCQQGLLQVFHDFCESDAMTCSECGFLTAVEGRAG